MPVDRTHALRSAEKLLRQGRLDQAIAEYVRLLEDQPHDWNTANLLGDLYVRVGRADSAIERFITIADALVAEGFLPRAAALYKKVLKLSPKHEHTLLQLAEIAARQGLLADARSLLAVVGDQRQARGDQRGVADVARRRATLDPTDLSARRAAARAQMAAGEVGGAVRELKALAAELQAKDHQKEAIDVLGEASRLDPSDRGLKLQLVRAFIARGDLASAGEHLTPDLAADDPQLLLTLARSHLTSGRASEAIGALRRLLNVDPSRSHDVAALGWSVVEQAPETSFKLVGLFVDNAVAHGDWTGAVAALQEFVRRVPGCIPALIRLVEVSVDGELEGVSLAAQAQLADAYLASGSATEALYIAEDLFTRNPDDAQALHRLRQALAAAGEPDPATVIASLVAERSQGDTVDLSSEPIIAERSLSTDVPSPPFEGSAPDESLTSKAEDEAAGTLEIDLSRALEWVTKQGQDPVPSPNGGPAESDALLLRGLGPDDADENLARAVALEQAGRLEECVAPLKAAARSARCRFAAASRLARVHRACGRPLEAIDWFERAAEAPPPSPEEGHLLLYELADALESLGEYARALAICLELLANAGDYRDVRARVDRLVNIETRG